MPKKPEPSWDLKVAVWDLAAKLGIKPAVIQRDLDKLVDKGELEEDVPDARTIMKIIEEYQLLPVAVLKTLPKHTWLLRKDRERIRVQLEEAPGRPWPGEQGPNTWEGVLGLTQAAESWTLAAVGQVLAGELDKLAPRVLRCFGCFDIGLKALLALLSKFPGQRFDAWVEPLNDLESFLVRRGTVHGRILNDANNACGPLGFVDNNFALAAYHLLARGDETWLADERFQVVQLGAVGPVRRRLECPRCSHSVLLQEWDTRGFICPEHEAPLIQKGDAIPVFPLLRTGEAGLYQESVVPIEDIASENPSRGTISLRVPGMQPFSEVVVAVGEMPYIPLLRRLVQDFLRTSSTLSKDVKKNERELQHSYARLLSTLRSTPTV